MNKVINLASIVYVILAGCLPSTEQPLRFQSLSDHYSFRTKGACNEPQLVVVANKDEVIPPNPDLEFTSDGARNEIAQTDFQQSFVILIRHGRSRESARIKAVSRQGDTVALISTPDSTIGNYVVSDYTFPYELITVTKEGTWNTNIRFVLKTDEQGTRMEITHFIP